MTNIVILKFNQFTHSPGRQRVDKGPEGDAVAAAAIMTCSCSKHARRPCKLAPGRVMIAAHLPLLRDGRRADQVLQRLGQDQVLQWLGRPGKFPLDAINDHLLEHDVFTWNQDIQLRCLANFVTVDIRHKYDHVSISAIKKELRFGSLVRPFIDQILVLYKKTHPTQKNFCKHPWHGDTTNKADISGEEQSWFFCTFFMAFLVYLFAKSDAPYAFLKKNFINFTLANRW